MLQNGRKSLKQVCDNCCISSSVIVKKKRIVTKMTSQLKVRILVIFSQLLFINNGTSGQRRRSAFMASMKNAEHQAESGRETDRATV